MSRRLLMVFAACVAIGCWGFFPTQSEVRAEAPPPAPPLPPISSLQVEPPALMLNGGRDVRRFLVTGRTADGRRIDLTRQATLEAKGEEVTLDAAGFVT